MPLKIPPKRELKPGEDVEPRISDFQLEMIGAVTAHWARLEGALEDTIWHFLKLDGEDGRLVTARLDARPKVEILGALGKRYIPAGHILEKFKKLLAHISDLAADRNFIVHGIWGTLTPDNVPIASSLRPKADPWMARAEAFTDERMRWTIREILTAARALNDLPAALAASRGKSPPQPHRSAAILRRDQRAKTRVARRARPRSS
ncbi:MAG TPA: hypothetical protein VN802_12345 [Stellaceae bacterium]|nr:hypothetical protein [Stellaceae bacterium]